MNLELATGPIAQATGWALLHLLWQGALVAAGLAALLVLVPRRSANLRYAASCLALLLLLVLGVATGIASYDDAPAGRLAAPIAAGTALEASGPAVVPAPAPSPWPDRLQALGHAAHGALPLFVTLWFLGVSAFSLRLVVEWLRTRRLLARSVTPAPADWQAVAGRLGRALGVRHAVRLLESTAVAVPAVVGVVRPAILLPASALSGLTPGQLEMILAHELAHIRRHDFLVNLLQSVVETLLFYHPAVWWISRRVRDERENCCDDLAIAVCGSALQYARALTRLEELRGGAPLLAASATGGSLLGRIRRIVGGPARDRDRGLRGAVALSAVTCVLLALATLTLPAIGQRDDGGRPKDPVMLSAIVGLPVDSTPAPEVATAALDAALVQDDEDGSGDVTAADDPADAGTAPPASSRDDEGKPTLDELIAMRVHGVTAERIREVRALFPGTSLEDIVAMSAVGATPEFVRAMHGSGLAVDTARQAISLAAVGVNVSFLRDMRAAGLAVESADEAQGLAAVGVTGEFVRGLRAAGIAVSSASEATSLAAVGVTPDYVRRMRRAGVELGGAEQAQSLRALGVTPEFVERLARAGYANLSVEQLTRLGASGVTGGFVEEMSKYRSK